MNKKQTDWYTVGFVIVVLLGAFLGYGVHMRQNFERTEKHSSLNYTPADRGFTPGPLPRTNPAAPTTYNLLMKKLVTLSL